MRIRIRDPFPDGPEKFSHAENRSKISNLMITELFYSHIININRGSIRYKKFQAYTPLCL